MYIVEELELLPPDFYENYIKEVGKRKSDKILAGTLFVHNGIKQDYCYREAIASLKELCDFVVIVDAGSNDGTAEDLISLVDSETHLINFTNKEWHEHIGREKLAYFTNVAIEAAIIRGCDYQFNLQADEVIHEDSFSFIRQAVELGEEAYYCTRHNLWGSPYTMLNVPQSRKPVSTQICRLAKPKYKSVGDAESLEAPSSPDFINLIEVFHMGFVRDKVKHIEKIRHIQDEVFLIDHDKRIDGMEEFDAWKFGFTKNDVIPIRKELPKFVKKWAAERK